MTKRTVPPVKLKMPGSTDISETIMAPVEAITVLPGFNLRVDEDIDDLAAKIEANGFYADKPLAGYQADDGAIILVDGHRRLAAVRRLNETALDPITELPVVLRAGGPADVTIAMIATSEGLPLTMFEKGIGVRRLMDGGMTKADVARRLGCSEKTIDNYLLVANVPTKARDLLLDGKVTSTQVLRAKGDTARLTAMVATAASKGRTRARPSDAPVTAPPAATSDAKAPVEPTIQSGETAAPAAGSTDPFDVSVVAQGDMRTVLQRVAAEIRKRVPHSAGDDDMAFVNATVSVTVTLADTKAPRKRKAAPVPAGLTDAPPAQLPLEDEL